MPNLVIAQHWREYERGWGSRPDGYTIHLTPADCKEFIRRYWAGMPSEAPDDYSAPYGVAGASIVTDEEYEKLKNSDLGMYMPQDWRPTDG